MALRDVCVVLPAGGCGVRMKIDTPKQYCQVLNRPLILHTIHSFHRISWIKQIVVAVAESYMEYMTGLLEKHRFSKVKLVEGLPTRHRSIYNGVKALEGTCQPDDVVLIHDAVRMFTDEQTIQEVAMAAKTHKASGVYRPLVSTVIAPDSNGLLEESLDRNKYKASEMPQGFHYNIIASAYQQATDFDFDYGTECLLLAMKYSGVRAKLIEGSSNLWKVTHKKDLYAAEGVIKESGIRVYIKSTDRILRNLMENKLQKKSFQVIHDQLESNEEPDIVIHILCYDEYFTETISQYVTSIQCNGKRKEHNLLDHVVMLVIKLTDDNQYLKVVSQMKQLKKEFKESLVYCVTYKDDSDTDQLTDTLTSVVWSRDPVLSGQVLIV